MPYRTLTIICPTQTQNSSSFTGTDDMRAPEQTHYSRLPSRGIFRPSLNVDYPTWPSLKSIYDDPIHPSERINVPGYRYLPISRETYGISPRNIYPHNYSSPRYGKYAELFKKYECN